MTEVAVRRAGHATVAGVRSKIAAGDIDSARRLFDVLHARLGPVTDVLLTEGLLLEAEGDLEAALRSIQRASISNQGSIQANAQAARLLMRLGRAAEAEAAALVTLALDDANMNALTVLAFC